MVDGDETIHRIIDDFTFGNHTCCCFVKAVTQMYYLCADGINLKLYLTIWTEINFFIIDLISTLNQFVLI